MSLFGASLLSVSVAIGVIGWPHVARLTRAEFLKIGGLDYVTASRAVGASDWRFRLAPRRGCAPWWPTNHLQKSQAQEDTIKSLRTEITELRKQATAYRKAERAAHTSLSSKNARLVKARESAHTRKDTIRSLHSRVRSLEREIARLNRDLEEAETVRHTARRLSDQVLQLNAQRRDWNDQSRAFESMSRHLSDLRMALMRCAGEKRWLGIQLADRPLLPVAVKKLRAQEKMIESLSKRNARLEAMVAKLQATRAVLSKARFGSRSEQQEKLRSERRRDRQLGGAAAHGRTQRPALEERIEEPPLRTGLYRNLSDATVRARTVESHVSG